ncbi:MAG: hypothetical protein ACTSVA_03000 [Candidatus Njordarchaeales archaeon]
MSLLRVCDPDVIMSNAALIPIRMLFLMMLILKLEPIRETV